MRPTSHVALSFLVFACAGRGPAAENAGVVPAPDAADFALTAPTDPATTPASPAPENELRCLPFATCGCFSTPECVAGRVQANGTTFDIVDGPRAGETGHVVQSCAGEGEVRTDCVDYVDPAMVCRRLQPSRDRAAKYLCSMDDIRPEYTCGFKGAVCQVL
jgi:hypothetical protein